MFIQNYNTNLPKYRSVCRPLSRSCRRSRIVPRAITGCMLWKNGTEGEPHMFRRHLLSVPNTPVELCLFSIKEKEYLQNIISSGNVKILDVLSGVEGVGSTSR